MNLDIQGVRKILHLYCTSLVDTLTLSRNSTLLKKIQKNVSTFKTGNIFRTLCVYLQIYVFVEIVGKETFLAGIGFECVKIIVTFCTNFIRLKLKLTMLISAFFRAKYIYLCYFLGVSCRFKLFRLFRTFFLVLNYSTIILILCKIKGSSSKYSESAGYPPNIW